MKRILYVTGCIVMAFAMMIIGTSEAKAVTATASSEYDAGYAASKAIDGSPDTRWSASAAGDAWIQLNYDTPQVIQGLQVYPLSWTFNTVDVEYVNGLGELEAVANLAVNGDSPMRISFCPVETKTIRLNLINNTVNNPSLSEIGVVFIEIAASSEYNADYGAGKAIDGVIGVSNNRWSASGVGDAWVQLNYTNPEAIQSIEVYPENIGTVDVEYLNENCELEAVANQVVNGSWPMVITFCPVVTKSIRLNITNNPGTTSIYEMGVLFQEAIEASSEYSGYGVDKLIDGVIGDFGNRWSASGAGDAWIQFNYDTPQMIEGLEIYPQSISTVYVEYLNENCELEAITNLVVSGNSPMVISFCPVETKSIRLNMTNNPGTPSIYEMAVLFQEPQEPIEASSEYDADYAASKAIDGSPDTRWSASAAGDAWIQVNYDTLQSIQGLQVYPLSWTFNTVDVEYLNENCELEAVTNLVVNGDWPMMITFCPVETKGIRLNLINNTGNAPSLSEMAVLLQTGIPADCDEDGITDACEESDIDVLCAELGAIIDAQVPPTPTDPYKNHGEYVSQVAHAATLLVAAECHLSVDDAEDLHSCLVSTRAKSGVGRK